MSDDVGDTGFGLARLIDPNPPQPKPTKRRGRPRTSVTMSDALEALTDHYEREMYDDYPYGVLPLYRQKIDRSITTLVDDSRPGRETYTADDPIPVEDRILGDLIHAVQEQTVIAAESGESFDVAGLRSRIQAALAPAERSVA